jgi:hypothetical protein
MAPHFRLKCLISRGDYQPHGFDLVYSRCMKLSIYVDCLLPVLIVSFHRSERRDKTNRRPPPGIAIVQGAGSCDSLSPYIARAAH